MRDDALAVMLSEWLGERGIRSVVREPMDWGNGAHFHEVRFGGNNVLHYWGHRPHWVVLGVNGRVKWRGSVAHPRFFEDLGVELGKLGYEII